MKLYDVSASLYGDGTLFCTVCLEDPPVDEDDLGNAIIAEIEKRGAIAVKHIEIDDEWDE